MQGCALCGRSAIRHRFDLTHGELDGDDTAEYTVLGVLRGLLLCDKCLLEARLPDLMNLAGGEIGIVRGCLVQCAGNPPRHLRWVLPGGPRTWTKTVCPCCHGRASVQIITEVFRRPPSALWEGTKAAFRLLDPRRPDDFYDEEGDGGRADTGDPDPDRAGVRGPEVFRVAVDPGRGRPRGEDETADPDAELPARTEAQIAGE